MRRLLPAIAGTAAFALLLAACGGDEESPNAESNENVDPASLEAELTW